MEKTMNLEIIRRWVERMERNEDKQGVGRLCAVNANGEICFCALGLLADEYMLATGKGKWLPVGDFRRFVLDDTALGQNAFVLPDILADEVGIDVEGIGLAYEGPIHRMNDIEKKTFPEIAAKVRSKLKL
jgi:hypothetical protein